MNNTFKIDVPGGYCNFGIDADKNVFFTDTNIDGQRNPLRFDLPELTEGKVWKIHSKSSDSYKEPKTVTLALRDKEDS